eukprot:GEMP01065604.1.p1 GENE.GEMP01065604.1~~GEMP01065604.1.p1  ORF type:complete len:152 (+),score=45.56 GEMP01065604.1:162-617(+)
MKFLALWLACLCSGSYLRQRKSGIMRLLSHLPKNVTADHQATIISKLEAEEAKLQKNVVQLKSQKKNEQQKEKTGKNQNFREKMSAKDKAIWDQFNQWDHRMNQKSLAGARDILSKLKNAVHLIKKGALQGDQKAHEGLEKVVEQMTGYLS